MKNKIRTELIPCRQTLHSAGYDIYANEDMDIERWFKTFDTGVCFDGEECPVITYENEGSNIKHELYPKTWVGMIYPRSSMGFKYGLRFANTVCIIDQDYRDTIKISLAGERAFRIKKGDRYAQIIFMPVANLLDEEEPTKERSGGIGSTN